MKENRIIGILLTELATDKLKLEEELERLLNSDIKVNKRVKLIKKLLSEITINELNTIKIKQYIGVDEKAIKQLLTDNNTKGDKKK